jgi:predicted acylesterase/phospholipase RssA
MRIHCVVVVAATVGATAIVGAAIVGCSYMRTGGVLDKLNHPSEAAGAPPPRVDIATRVARLTRTHLSDAYVDPTTVALWMKSVADKPEVLLDFYRCLVDKGVSSAFCYDTKLIPVAVTAPLWGVPPVPGDASPEAIPVEVDAERFLANVLALGPSLAALRTTAGTDIADADLRAGIRRGTDDAAAYVTHRGWKRRLGKPATALVLSGGAANGAFSAGAMWRLMSILRACRGAPAPEGCGDAHIDVVAGTSTGALIGTILDLFSTPGQEAAATDLLVDSYTCTVESDLYCLNSTWIWEVASDLKGLVRFDGIRRKLESTVSRAMLENPMELVTVSVDYSSGDVYGVSDQDPADLMPLDQTGNPWKARIDGEAQAILASIVEPVLAEPVPWVPSSHGEVRGTFIDGGIRSGLPLLQAVQRGAERALIVSTSGIDPGSAPDQPNAVAILMRTLDLLVSQPPVSEVQQGELQAVARRFTEHNVCTRRLELSTMFDKPARGNFCARRGRPFDPPVENVTEGATNMWLGPAQFDQVATSWRSAWLYRPETPTETASAYAFTPRVMRPLFAAGVEAFQKRCAELLGLLDVRGKIARDACAEPVARVVDTAKASYKDIDRCTAGKPERRTCD